MSTVQTILPADTPSMTRTPSATLGKTDFLNLLVTQMKYQDPMDPMKGADFAAQLAQFSSLEQLTNINSNLETSLNANALLSNSINNALSATFIGKDVRASADSFRYNGSGSVKLGYSLRTTGVSAVVKILDGAGNVVRTIDADAGSGLSTITWDGTNDRGETVGSGSYGFSVEAKDANGGLLNASTYVYGTVAGVRFKSDGTVFVIDGVEISLANIIEIMQG